MHAPAAFVDKRRTDKGIVATTVVGDVSRRQAILFDDEVDRGSSACEAAELLDRSGAAEVYVACTHGVLSGPAVEKLSHSAIREVVVTDTVPVPAEKRWDRLVVLSIAPLLAEAIRRISTGESISALFG